jgi:ATP-independent RNA helicase DbpA
VSHTTESNSVDNASGFESLPLRSEILAAAEALGYSTMTPIQSQSLPTLIEGRDLIAQAKTGSGKTAAFSISLLNRLDESQYHTQALIVCPTRELAEQVAEEIRRLARGIPNVKTLTLCGGRPMGPQLASLRRAPHIVVGTPGRLLKHLEKQTLKINRVETLVLDEADRMLGMGFIEDIDDIDDYLPTTRQTLLFSATYPDEIAQLSASFQTDPVDIRIESETLNAQIKETFYKVDRVDRLQVILRLLALHKPESTLIFCNQKHQCEQLKDDLWDEKLHASALHGDMEQYERDRTLIQFSNKSSSILVATDVAARGLDINELDLVINFELSADPEVHIHRVGRTGRAGRTGTAASLVLGSEENRLAAINNYRGTAHASVSADTLPAWGLFKLYPPMVTLSIGGGKRDKLRPGDILGALTASKEIEGIAIGKITVLDKITYVAITQECAKKALSLLNDGKIKGKRYQARRLR